ncbi:MFS general substrate transporter [Schizopora paradoxa]|uniref:MFS general substrate transporter n=1 Tax=Schizopora paradoxa TaxID=27342 RepID=A0A0H2RY19_9AGAM|nr:MFS general substrate transporter [Schizopora paradoxa]
MDSKKITAPDGTDPIDFVDVLDTKQNNDSGSELQKDIYDDDAVDPIYRAKSHILNEAIQEIGMGRYQWWLFVVAGFGWFADSVWPVVSGLILTPAVNEFQFRPPFLSLAANMGFLVGAAFWGLGCDLVGRRWAFNITLFISGVFAIAAGGSPNFTTLAVLFGILGIGVGGNLPVDSAVFLEFIPGRNQYLLTIMSVWWAAGQLLASLLAWPLIANFSCPETTNQEACPRSQNKGWRYVMFLLGGLMFLLWVIRFFVFRLLESPRYLVGQGKDHEAIKVLHEVAAFNGKTCTVSVEDLQKVGENAGSPMKVNSFANVSRTSWIHIKRLFATKKMALSTTLLISQWGLIGLASTLYNSFLPFLFASKGAVFGDGSLNITYRNTAILSLTGVPGAFLAGWAVDLPFLGRRGTLMISCIVTAVLLFGTTTARSSNALLGWNCGYSFCSNIMYGVLYAISPEIFPARDRGTGNGLTALSTRVFGVLAPIIALYANIETAVPVYISGALIILAGFISLLLPFEPRGHSSL